jgi:hypothetical protein
MASRGGSFLWSFLRVSSCEKRLSVVESVTDSDLCSQTARYNQEIIESSALINRWGLQHYQVTPYVYQIHNSPCPVCASARDVTCQTSQHHGRIANIHHMKSLHTSTSRCVYSSLLFSPHIAMQSVGFCQLSVERRCLGKLYKDGLFFRL